MAQFLFYILSSVLVFSSTAHALNMELGASYNYKKTVFNADNYIDQQSTTGSISFYLFEKIALETSYTNSLYVKQEKASINSIPRTTTQYADIYGADLIYVFADRQAKFQPYIKGGAAYMKKRAVIQDYGGPATEIPVKPGIAPSYGIGLKFFLTQAFAIKTSYDVLQTPIDDTTKADDVMVRVGISWVL